MRASSRRAFGPSPRCTARRKDSTATASESDTSPSGVRSEYCPVRRHATPSSQLAPVINGVATVLMIVFIDPKVSIIADDVAQGLVSEGYFRRSIVLLAGSRLAGTLLAQVILVPSAYFVAMLADRL